MLLSDWMNLEEMKGIKYLCVIIDNKVNLKQHFERLCLKLSQKLRLFLTD